ncbi:DUF11 domain-containing protein [Catelliglobosispora koreensis]|uniref:DUF11 domain-containing protein n=1 Tax=Catelliglobosispora koreensis TaxID=129052 RepID=UPI00036C18F5|nr:DUF11 domain-containing protein [Catelliglobosispora koreensis]
MLGPAAHTLFAMLAYAGGPLMGVTDRPAETFPPAVNIAIADEARSVAKGQLTEYTLRVENNSGSELPVTIRLTLPAGVFSTVDATDATVVANAAAWRTTLAAGETRTLTISGTVDAHASRSDIPATACVHTSAGVPACATDLNQVQDNEGVRRYAWLVAIMLGFAAVLLSLWLQRIVRPEFLTPEVARREYGPRQPGGAPSA